MSILSLDPSTGTSTDWVYAQADVVYTYLVEMIPSKGTIPTSFMLPPEMMLMNAQDMLTGITNAAREFRPKVRHNKRSNDGHLKQEADTTTESAVPLRAHARCIMGSRWDVVVISVLACVYISCERIF